MWNFGWRHWRTNKPKSARIGIRRRPKSECRAAEKGGDDEKSCMVVKAEKKCDRDDDFIWCEEVD